MKKNDINTGICWKGNPERAYSKKDKKVMNGHYKNFHEDGSLNAIGTWINGFKEGAWQYFYENGLLFSRGFYKNDQKFPNEKSWEYFKESGERYSIRVFDDD